MCGLTAYGDVVVGSLGVEQWKRTTIAVELAAKVCRSSSRAVVGIQQHRQLISRSSYCFWTNRPRVLMLKAHGALYQS